MAIPKELDELIAKYSTVRRVIQYVGVLGFDLGVFDIEEFNESVARGEYQKAIDRYVNVGIPFSGLELSEEEIEQFKIILCDKRFTYNQKCEALNLLSDIPEDDAERILRSIWKTVHDELDLERPFPSDEES